MANVRVVLNRKGIRDLLRSDEIKAELERRAHAIAAAAGPGHTVDSQIGPHRARAAVVTDTVDAMLAESHHRNLTRAIDAGRD